MSNESFQKLQRQLANLLAEMSPGARLPAEPTLAKQLGVSRATLREAMRTFEAQGRIRRRQGSGTYVLGQQPVLEAGLEVLESLDKTARRFGLEIRVSDLKIDLIAANEAMARTFNISPSGELTRVRRVIWLSDHPAAYLVDILPRTVLHPEELPSTFNGSVLDFLLARGETLAVAKATISATSADSDLARALQIQRGDVLLQFTSLLYRSDGQVIDHALSYFVPGYFHFHVLRRVE